MSLRQLRSLPLFCAALLAAAALWMLTGCSKEPPVSADNSGYKASGGTDSGKSDAKDGDQPENGKTGGQGETDDPLEVANPDKPAVDLPAQDYKVPEGGADAQAAFLEKAKERLEHYAGLQGARLTREQGQSILEDMKRLMQARIDSSGRLLSDKKAKPEQRELAVETKFDSLGFMDELREPGASAELLAFAETLKGDENQKIRRQALTVLLDQEIERVARGDAENPQAMVAQLKSLLEGDDVELSRRLFSTAQDVANVLLQANHLNEGLEVLDLTVEKFKGAEDERLSGAAKSLGSQAVLIEMDIRIRQLQDDAPMAKQLLEATVNKAMAGEEFDMRTLMFVSQIARIVREQEHPELADKIKQSVDGKIDKVLSQEDIDAVTLDEVMELATQSEYSGNIPLAQKIYDGVRKALPQVKEEETAKHLEEMLDDAQKRIGLIGEPFVIEGNTLEGEPFKWEDYKDKVVLVDFWATWCGPCLREIPNIVENYEKFHEKGFDVVGVNIDEDRRDLDDFFARRELPWQTVVSGDPDKVGFESPMATKAGVTGIPFLVLVGKDGKVVDIHVRGDDLTARLTELLGPPAEEKPDAEKPDAEKPDAEKPDTEKPDAEKPDAEKPDTEKPDTEKPDAEKPDAEKPATDEEAAPPALEAPKVDENE